MSITESGDGMTEVVAGLKGGETIILDSSGLKDGQQVKAGAARAATTATIAPRAATQAAAVAPKAATQAATPSSAEARQ